MMPNERPVNRESSIDPKTIWRDLKKQAVTILLVAAAVAMLSFIWYSGRNRNYYSVEATYAVTTQNAGNNMVSSLKKTQNMAALFSQVINSSVLKNRVQEDLGESMQMAQISSYAIPETNLISLRCTSDNVESAFRTLKSVMKNYQSVSDFAIGDTRLIVLIQPRVPAEADHDFHPYSFMGKVFLIVFLALLGVAALLSYLKDTVRSGEDMENKLNARYLGAIGHEEKYRTLRSKFIRTVNPLLISSHTVSFRFAESVVKAARKVKTQMDKGKAKSLLVTSCLENEGKSTVAANLALALAKSGERVVLVDLDLRKPAQHHIFGETEDDGTLIQKVKNEELYLIPSLWKVAGAVEDIRDEYLENFLDYLKEHFSYVILDTPPMGYVADAEAIASVADASLCVVREHVALVRDINNMIENLSCYRAKPIGCILNDSYSGWWASLGGHEYRREYGSGKGYGNYG